MLCALVATCLVACGGGARESTEPRIESSGPVGWPNLGSGPARWIRVDLGPDTFTECRSVSPEFPFDSAVTYAQDRDQIGALASCLNMPSIRERKIVLVGRADAQGIDPYNEELGLKRAKAIEQILVESGISESRIELATEGAKGAMGDKPEYSPGYDRRVDVVVKGGTHAP